MISDTLSDAVHSIDEYLNDPVFDACYTGSVRLSILDVRNRMDHLRIILDTLPKKEKTS
jgi:hypothetical protein